MRKLLLSLCLIATTFSLFATESMTYRLELVTEVKGGEKYVFVQNGRAIAGYIEKGALSTTDQYSTSGLTGNEIYVCSLKYVSKTDAYKKYQIFINNSMLYNVNSSVDLTFTYGGNYHSNWVFTFTDNTAKITTNEPTGRFLGLTNASATTYKAYSGAPSASQPGAISVYHLVPDNYARDIAAEKVGTVGTICLPYQVTNPSGATFYQLAYKTLDDQQKPSEVYYEAVEGPLVAGHAYMFISTDTQLQLPADTDVPLASAPVAVNGFYGTFQSIQDKTSADPSNLLVNNYMVTNNQIQLCGLGCGLSPYRAYIKMDEVPPLTPSTPAPTRQMVVLGQQTQPQIIDPQSDTTTSRGDTAEEQVRPVKVLRNGQIGIRRGDVLYNLLGAQQ